VPADSRSGGGSASGRTVAGRIACLEAKRGDRVPATSNRTGQPHERARFLTVAEVAAQLRVSTMTVYRLIKAGQLASVRVGKSYRVREDDVDRYLASTYTQAG
jgi:excisionase family DNA binding protein